MSVFDVPISGYLGAALHTVGPDALLPEVQARLQEAGVSAIAIVDSKLRPLGVVSRTDLVQAGAIQAATGGTESRLTLPNRRVSDIVRGHALCVAHDASLRDAVRLMREHRVHRVLVTELGQLRGVISAWDAMQAVANSRIQRAIGTMMSSPVLHVHPEEPAARAIEQLRAGHVHGVVVVEHGWPVGVFAQEEALFAELWPANTTVEQWFNPAVLTLPPNLPAHRAAAQACAMRARYLVVMDLEGASGIVTPSDFLELELEPT